MKFHLFLYRNLHYGNSKRYKKAGIQNRQTRNKECKGLESLLTKVQDQSVGLEEIGHRGGLVNPNLKSNPVQTPIQPNPKSNQNNNPVKTQNSIIKKKVTNCFTVATWNIKRGLVKRELEINKSKNIQNFMPSRYQYRKC